MSDFWWILEAFWEPFSMNFQDFSKNAESTILLEKQWKINDFAPPKLPFSNQNSIEFSSFFHHPFLNIIFPTFDASWCQNARFWDTHGAQQCPKWSPKTPKRRQIDDRMQPPKLRWCSEILFLEPTWSQGRFRNAPGHHFRRFGMDFWWVLNDFGISLAQFPTILATTLQTTEAACHVSKNRKPSRTNW